MEIFCCNNFYSNKLINLVLVIFLKFCTNLRTCLKTVHTYLIELLPLDVILLFCTEISWFILINCLLQGQNQSSGGGGGGGADGDKKDKKKKYEPPVPTRVGKKKKRMKGPDTANKLPQGGWTEKSNSVLCEGISVLLNAIKIQIAFTFSVLLCGKFYHSHVFVVYLSL